MLHQKSTFLAIAAISLLSMPLAHAHRIDSTKAMTETAKRLLASLTSEQSGKATFKFEDDERMNWHFIPKERKGLPLKDMTPPQKHLATALLSAGLSQTGFIKATTIMSLEDILRIMEKDNGVRRNPDGYFFSIFGEPSETGVWGYRVEGHHLALNFTLKGGKVTGGPNFMGANPGRSARRASQRPARSARRGRPRTRARRSLTPEQKKVAVVSKEAPEGHPDHGGRARLRFKASRMACKPRS